jgi:hypothetical protein
MGVETKPFHGLVAFLFYLVLLCFFQIIYPNNHTAFQLFPKTMLVLLTIEITKEFSWGLTIECFVH